MVPKTVIVVPCYNEQRRLRPGELLPVLKAEGTHLLLVDDGSSDGTATLLESMAAQHPGRVSWRGLGSNHGKAEAVRLGMLDALSDGAEAVGFVDADASTPADEVLRLVQELRAGRASVVMGARVALLGSQIRRGAVRHFLGRLFATAASTALALPVYDTQCGAKLFRDSPALRAAVARPFRSRWAFDVELIGRLLLPPPGIAPLAASDFLEIPVRRWEDVGGSKLTLGSMIRAGLDLVPIAREVGLARRRRLKGDDRY